VEVDGQRRHATASRYRFVLEKDRLSLVTFGHTGRGMIPLRKRGLIADSPRIMARDRRGTGE
jgi:hypothetical protein